MAVRNLIILSAILFLLITASAQAGKTYVWTDENGVTQITDTPPPAKVRQTTKVQSKNVDAVPTEEERKRAKLGEIKDKIADLEGPDRCGINRMAWGKKYTDLLHQLADWQNNKRKYPKITSNAEFYRVKEVYRRLENWAADCAVPKDWRIRMEALE